MTRSRIGIDTSVLVRLVTGQPPDACAHSVERLSALVEGGAEVPASNQFIAEAYITVRHHYGAAREDARAAIRDVLLSGLVAPLGGRAVLDALCAPGGPGLFDRLIAEDYSRAGMETLTLDRAMASLPGARRP